MKKAMSTMMVLLGGAVCACFLLGAKPVTTLTLKAELERPVLPAGIQQDALIRITINAPDIPIQTGKKRGRVNLAVVLDRSGSMSGANKLSNAKAAAITALKLLGPNDIFSLVIYDHNVQTLIPPTLVKGNAEEIEGRINQIQPGGNTALFAGVSVGANEVRKNLSDRYVNRIILLSDGLANVGPSSPADLGRLGASLIKEGISVSTVGVGNDYNEDLMTSISQNSDGNFYFVENSNDLPMIFSKELGGALKVYAKSIKIRIKCPDGVRPRGIIGRECRIDGNNIDLYFNQVYGGHQKSLVLQLDVPPEKENKKLTLASINMDFQDLNGITKQVNENVSATFSSSRKEVEQKRNLEVMNTVALQKVAVEKQKAIEAADKGDLNKASAIMKNAARELKDVAEITKDEDLQKEIQRSNVQADQLEEQSKTGKFKKSSRKQMKGESFQSINDQYYKQ